MERARGAEADRARPRLGISRPGEWRYGGKWSVRGPHALDNTAISAELGGKRRRRRADKGKPEGPFVLRPLSTT